ncbi:MAG: type I restriction enzyme HsdR N-terminal domain-containing protein [Chitinophagaceae bacterium]|nr:type I restriction enzyme HsdR N-terminal domain-containing protein [Chitinophagaceae bacterium]
MFEKIKIKEENGKQLIYDIIRKKYVTLSPEEWVRQQLIHHFTENLQYPKGVFSVEKQLKIGDKKKRYDLVVYKNDMPWMIVECKEENELLNKQVLNQILSYNIALKVKYLVITNGKEIYCFNTELKKWQDDLPEYL